MAAPRELAAAALHDAVPLPVAHLELLARPLEGGAAVRQVPEGRGAVDAVFFHRVGVAWPGGADLVQRDEVPSVDHADAAGLGGRGRGGRGGGFFFFFFFCLFLFLITLFHFLVRLLLMLCLVLSLALFIFILILILVIRAPIRTERIIESRPRFAAHPRLISHL
jgi:hypothetical protein